MFQQLVHVTSENRSDGVDCVVTGEPLGLQSPYGFDRSRLVRGYLVFDNRVEYRVHVKPRSLRMVSAVVLNDKVYSRRFVQIQPSIRVWLAIGIVLLHRVSRCPAIPGSFMPSDLAPNAPATTEKSSISEPVALSSGPRLSIADSR